MTTAGRHAALLAGLAAMALGLPSCGPEPLPVPERVLLLVMDTTHAAHLGCYGGPQDLSPNVDRLAARGRRFASARSNHTWTLPSTVSLLTGQLQETHGVVTNQHVAGDDLGLLPESFQAAGYRTAGFVEMIYASGRHGLQRGFDDYTYYPLVEGHHVASLVHDVRAWIDAHRDERWFLYVHLRRPHSPYEGNALIERALGPDCIYADGQLDELLAHADARIRGDIPEDQKAHVTHLYRGNVANADRTVGQLLEPLLDDPDLLVALTSDHGEALGQRGTWGHGKGLEAECIDIPLIFTGPGVAPGVDTGPACTVDMAPTLTELCGLEPLPAGDGLSLAARLAGDAPDDERPLFLSSRYNVGKTPVQGVVAGRFKLVLEADGSSVLYDLEADPGELRDVTDDHQALAAKLRERVEARRRAGQGLAERDQATGLGDHEDELRALGYVR